MGVSEVDLNYAWHLTLYEVLELVIQHCGEAENSSDPLVIGVHLKMASRAMRCALEIYGLQLEVPKEEQK
jgi:hypothetical protein